MYPVDEPQDHIATTQYVVDEPRQTVVCIVTDMDGVQEFGQYRQFNIGRKPFDVSQARELAKRYAIDRLKQRTTIVAATEDMKLPVGSVAYQIINHGDHLDMRAVLIGQVTYSPLNAAHRVAAGINERMPEILRAVGAGEAMPKPSEVLELELARSMSGNPSEPAPNFEGPPDHVDCKIDVRLDDMQFVQVQEALGNGSASGASSPAATTPDAPDGTAGAVGDSDRSLPVVQDANPANGWDGGGEVPDWANPDKAGKSGTQDPDD